MAGDDNNGGSFLRELKRRKVLRTCVYYILACWAILQVMDIVLPAIGLDADMYSRYFLYAAVAGFPINFALAWYFQVTTDGIVKTDTFVERRVLNNIPPINDKRHGKVTNYFQKDGSQYNWIISAETGTLSGLSFGVSEEVVLGRSLECELAIVSPHVSRRHAKLVVDESDQLYVEDLGSANGTVVNGKLVQGNTPLRHEDELRFHDVIFRITESYAGKRSEKDSMNQTTFIDRSEGAPPGA
ncbi:MAG: FHA domain-containing protein [Halioglobus sp.]